MCTGEVDDEGVDARRLAGLIASPRGRCPSGPARAARTRRPFWCAWRSRAPREVALGGDRKAGLDDVDAHRVEQLGDFELLLDASWWRRALLAVCSKVVSKNPTPVGIGIASFLMSIWP
jgi:hypothetical protein